MSKNVLITGFPGQDACYLADLLLEKSYNVFGLVKRYTAPNYDNLDFLRLRERGLNLIVGDVLDFGSIFEALKVSKPDEIYNLAAQSYVGHSWRLSHVTGMVDAMGPLVILNCIKEFNDQIKFYQAATSEMFGNNNDNGFQTESTAFMPCSPYGVAKLYGYHITRNYRESFNMFACSGILFNHESPIRGIEFVTRKVTNGVAKIKLGLEKKLFLGNLDAERDWGHAKDFVKAQYLMLQQDKPRDYIVATGQKRSVRELCRVAFLCAGIKNWEDFIEVKDEFIRPSDLITLQAKSNKAKDELNWIPEISFEDMISEMVEKHIKLLK